MCTEQQNRWRFMLAQHGGRNNRGWCRNDPDQAAVPGCNEILHEEIRCYSYQRNCQYSDQCPNQNGTNLAQVGLNITQNIAAIKHTWVILDNFPTNSVSNNADLVKEIITCKNHKKITVTKNGGLKSFNKKATLKRFPMTVHFNQNSMTTILSFKEVTDILRVKITTEKNEEHAMMVTPQNEKVLQIQGMWIWDLFLRHRK